MSPRRSTTSILAVALVAAAVASATGFPTAVTASTTFTGSVGEATTADEVTGFTTIGGYPAKVEVDLAPGASATAGEAVLNALHATTMPSNLFFTSGFAWPQFFDPGRADDHVVEYYNPAGEPFASQQLVQDALLAWSAVPGSSFRFAFGGTTARCPSLIGRSQYGLSFCPGSQNGFADGFNDIGWGPMAPLIAGLDVSLFTLSGEALETDVGLNTLYPLPWHTDGSFPDIEFVALHELGHAAGLGHSLDPDSVMYAMGGSTQHVLGKTDLDAMTFLYPTKPATFVETPAAYGFRVLARLGDPAPGGGVFQNDFEPGALNARGDLAFVSDVTEGEGLFVAANGQLRQIVRSGESLAGFTLGPGSAEEVGLDDAGDVAFAWLFNPFGFPFGANAGLFLAQGNAVRALVVPGTPAPGGGVFEGARSVRISNRGDVAFTGLIGGLYGVFVAQRDGSIVQAARSGEPAPRGGVFVGMLGSAITDQGDVGFTAETSVASSGVYVAWASGRLEEIAGPGDAVPGGGTFFDATAPRVNAEGDVLFGGRSFTPSGVLSRGIYLAHGGSIERVAGFGDVMPDGWRYVRSGLDPVWSLNDRGEVAFVAIVENDAGIRRAAIYAGRPGALSLVARVGTVVPGLGGIFGVNGAIIDDRGDVAFVAFTGAGPMLVEAAPKA